MAETQALDWFLRGGAVAVMLWFTLSWMYGFVVAKSSHDDVRAQRDRALDINETLLKGMRDLLTELVRRRDDERHG